MRQKAKSHKELKVRFILRCALFVRFTSGREFLHVIATRAEPLEQKDCQRHDIDAHKEDENPREDVERLCKEQGEAMYQFRCPDEKKTIFLPMVNLLFVELLLSAKQFFLSLVQSSIVFLSIAGYCISDEVRDNSCVKCPEKSEH